jgi:hypothetical protein
MTEIKRLLIDHADPLGAAILHGADNPATVGVAAAIGSEYHLDSTGGIFKKFGPLNTDWVELAEKVTGAAYADLAPYGAKGDGRGVTNAAMTSGSATLTSATAAFTSADTGKAISVEYAGTPVAGTGTLTAAAGVGTFSASQTGVLGESSGVIVSGTLYLCTAWNGGMTTCTLSGAPTFGAAAFTVAKTLLTTLTYVNATTVTLAATAGQTVTGATAHFGTDNTVALQAAIDACSASNLVHGTVPRLQLGIGQYKISGKLRFKNYRVAIHGADMDQTAVHYEGVSAGGFVADVVTGLNVDLCDLSIYGDASSGHAIDLSSVGVDNVYLSRFARLKIFAGLNAIYSTLLFSGSIEDVYGESRLEHIYRIRCGPSVAWKNVYAGRCPMGKAGYRIAGTFHPRSCNGVNSGGYWAILGSNTAGTDGFQGDFAVTDYVDFVADGCNFEAWGVTAVYLAQQAMQTEIIGGTISRGLASSYHSFFRALLGPVIATQALLTIRGTRALITGGAATASNVYCDNRGYLVLYNDNTGFTGSFSAADSVLYPAITLGVTKDGSAHTFLTISGLQTDRLKPTVMQPLGVTATYSATIAVNGQAQSRIMIVATNGTAFTISNPTNGFVDQVLTFTIRNTSGGALGLATWGGNYLMSAWTQPANGFSRSITFVHDGSKYLEVSRTPADVPN